MGVIRRGNSKYWYIQFQHKGRTYVRSSKTFDKRVAEMIEREWRLRLTTQQALGRKEPIELHTAMTKLLLEKKHLASYGDLSRHAKNIVAFFGEATPMHEVRSSDIDRWKNRLQSLGYSNQTILHSLGTLRRAHRLCRRLGHELAEVEFPSISLPKGKLRYLSIDEEKRMLEAIDPRRSVKGLAVFEKRPEQVRQQMEDLHHFVVLLLDTGARYSEIARLEWSQVNFEDRAIALWRPKVQNESVIYMTTRVAEMLEKRATARRSQFVFTNKKGNGPRGYAMRGIRKAFTRAGLTNCTVHTLRHTHATRLIQNGLSIYEVKEILGHADIRTTMRYAHIESRHVSLKARSVMEALSTASTAS